MSLRTGCHTERSSSGADNHSRLSRVAFVHAPDEAAERYDRKYHGGVEGIEGTKQPCGNPGIEDYDGDNRKNRQEGFHASGTICQPMNKRKDRRRG